MDTSVKTKTPRLASDITRNLIAVGITIALVLALPFILVASGFDDIPMITASSLLTAWSLMALASTVATWLVFRRASGSELRRWLAGTTPHGRVRRIVWQINGGGGISWAITGSAIAIVAIVVIGANPDFRGEPIVVIPAISVVASSVLMIISAYAVHYARENTRRGGIAFPEGIQPRFADYFYLAAMVSTTFSSSDVVITRTAMRRTLAAHSLFAFAFNTVIVALLVSMLIVTIS